MIAIFFIAKASRAKTLESNREGRQGTLTSGARVSHWGSIVLGLPPFHKFVLSIVRRLTPRFAQKCNENNNRANIILLYVLAPLYREQRCGGKTFGAARE